MLQKVHLSNNLLLNIAPNAFKNITVKDHNVGEETTEMYYFALRFKLMQSYTFDNSHIWILNRFYNY